jgi:hypothetical protein
VRHDPRARLEDVVAGSEPVFPVRWLASDGHEAWGKVDERGYEGYVARTSAGQHPAEGVQRRERRSMSWSKGWG